LTFDRLITIGIRTPLRVVAATLLALVLIIVVNAPASARYASLVMDTATGKVLHAVNADTRNYPASLTKMMTLFLMFEELESGRWTLKTPIKISARAARQPASRLGLKRGQTITVEQAVLAMVTKSANDVAAAVAEALGGSERKFALRMTKRARQLGMTRTTFRNASGLPHRGQLSTARDMARLARALIEDKAHYYHYFSIKRFKFAGATHKNHNKLLVTYDGTDGIKTGYIRASGFNLVASAKRGNRRLVGVVLGGKSPKHRNSHMTTLLDKGFRAVDSTLPVIIAKVAELPPIADDPQSAHARQMKVGPTKRLGRWGIQVGAFKTYGPAHKVARKAVSLAPTILDTGVVAIVPLKKRGKVSVYRARILGLGKKEAYRACRVLKKRRVSCMELRLPKNFQVATRS
jgi:D-alanyl-D-alanine carboxypeptidase